MKKITIALLLMIAGVFVLFKSTPGDLREESGTALTETRNYFSTNLPSADYSSATIRIGGKTLQVDLAVTSAERGLGLSGRASLSDGDGMLFIFELPDAHGFWMKDMLFPIDIIWFDENKIVVYVESGVLPESYPKVFTPNRPAKYVLETKSGFAAENGIGVGDSAEFLLY